MREIKFRAWHKRAKVIAEMPDAAEDFVFTEDGHRVASDCSIDHAIFYKDIQLMQFTGLQDVNGVDIYEGDIVRWSVNDVTPVGVVTYDQGWYDLKKPNTVFSSIGWDFLRGESEVIGNIYQNPELIEVAA